MFCLYYEYLYIILVCSEFAWGKASEILRLESGDVMIGNFGYVVHGLLNVDPPSTETAPGWWLNSHNNDTSIPSKSTTVNTFGRARCNIQLRDSTTYKKAAMSSEQYKVFLHNSARMSAAAQKRSESIYP